MSIERGRRLEWLLPGLARLLGYRRAFLRADLVAGLTVGAMLVPQCMAYAELARMPPQAGFHAALFALVVYAFVGTSRHLGVGPEPGTAILAATGVAALAGGDPARHAALMPTLAFLVGVVGVVGAVARLGFLAELLSKPVLVGYITGVALTLLSSQIGKVTGIPIAADGFFSRCSELFHSIERTNPATLALASATLALLLVLRRKAPTLPSALIGVVAATVVSSLLHLEARGVKLVGPIPAGLPHPAWPAFALADVLRLVPVALGIALVGYTDNVLTARAIGQKLGYRIEPNHELGALGLVNLASSLSGGFPISSSASRTAVPASLGSHTQLVGLVAAAFLFVALEVLHPWLSAIPQAALGAVIVSAALAILDLEGLRSLGRISRPELAIALATALSVMAFDVLTGVLLAVAASVIFAFARMAVPHDAVLAMGETLDGWVDAELYGASGTKLPGLLVYRFDAPLFFANANRFRERLEEVLERNPGEERWIVLDFEGIGDVDATAVDVLAEVVAEQRAAGRVVAVTRTNRRALEKLERAGLTDPERGFRVFATIRAAVRAFEATL